MTAIQEKIEKSLLFKVYIVLILNELYANGPSPARFDKNSVEKLTGYKASDDEDNITTFFETIDFLNREGYVYCSSFYVSTSISGEPIWTTALPVYISEKGMVRLESTYNQNQERFIDKFKIFASSIAGKVTENISTRGLTTGFIELIHHFLKMA